MILQYVNYVSIETTILQTYIDFSDKRNGDDWSLQTLSHERKLNFPDMLFYVNTVCAIYSKTFSYLNGQVDNN